MNRFFVNIEGYDEHGSRHEKSMTLIAKELNGATLCDNYAKEKNLTNVSIIRSRNLGPVLEVEPPAQNIEGMEDTTMATSKKKIVRKTKKAKK